jgi:hypothetical protein
MEEVKKKKPGLCLHKNCTKTKAFGDPIIKKRMFCKTHCSPGYINLVRNMCDIKNCNAAAFYSEHITKKASRCKIHKLDNFIYVKKGLCIEEDCLVTASYGIVGSKKHLYCSTHAKDDCVLLRKSNICKHPLCSTRASFSAPGEKTYDYCSEHKPEGYVMCSEKRCLMNSCSRIARYGVFGTRNIQYCSSHIPNQDYINLTEKRCIVDNCYGIGKYGSFDTKKKEYCKKHKNSDHVNLAKKFCIYPDCRNKAEFNVLSEKSPLYCKEHKLITHENKTIKKCIAPNCKKRAAFVIKDTTEKIYCGEHKTDNCINAYSRMCSYVGCEIIASFAKFQGKNIKLTIKDVEFCKLHSPPGYIIVKQKLCCYGECINYASWGVPTESNKQTKPLYCTDHKQAIHINTNGKKCHNNNCNRTAYYKNNDQNGYVYCHEHQGINSINLRKRSMCAISSCNKRAYYSKIGQTPQHCSEHKEPGEMKEPNKTCIFKDQYGRCKEKAFWGFKYALHCDLHKNEKEINFINQNCKKCGLPNILDNEGHCNYCNPKTIEKVYLAKQKKVKAYLDINLPKDKKYISYDTTVENCLNALERPDFSFETTNGESIILEVDENQHKDRNCECEITRMFNIANAIRKRTLFIRFNPDSYKTINGRPQLKEHDRYKELLNQILYWYDNFHNTNIFCGVIYLFFDNDDYNNYRNIIPLMKPDTNEENLV